MTLISFFLFKVYFFKAGSKFSVDAGIGQLKAAPVRPQLLTLLTGDPGQFPEDLLRKRL
jgi:hypothetical protein